MQCSSELLSEYIGLREAVYIVRIARKRDELIGKKDGVLVKMPYGRAGRNRQG